MEFALEDYGFVPAKLVRAEVMRRLDGDPQRAVKLQRMEHLMAMFSTHGDARSSVHKADLWKWMHLALSCVGVRSRRDADASTEIELPPELLSTLRGLVSSGSMRDIVLRTAIATKSAFDRLRQRGLALCLTDCSMEQGQDLYLGVYSPTLVADVAAGDAVAAGAIVALRGEPGGKRTFDVLRRIFRKVCMNGMVVFAGEGKAQEIDVDRLEEEPSLLEDILERELLTRLDGSVFQAAVDSFRRSDAEPLHESSVASFGAFMQPAQRESVMQRYRAGQRFTRWGLANAITAEARDLPRHAALELERVGALVAGVSELGSSRTGNPSLSMRAKRERIAS